MEMLKSDLRLDSVESQQPFSEVVLVEERWGLFWGDEDGAFKQISWKRLNANSIT